MFADKLNIREHEIAGNSSVMRRCLKISSDRALFVRQCKDKSIKN